MQSVNWWLVALSFLLGLVLTLFLLIRRVQREVPEYATVAAGAGAGTAGVAGAASLKGVLEDEPYGAGSVRVKETTTAPDAGYTVKGNEDSMLYHTTDSPAWKQTIAEIWFRNVTDAERAGFARWDSGGGGAKVAAGAAVKFAGSGDIDEPYGAGSARVAAGAAAPSGYDIKGNEDSMLYHTPESPSYKQTIAEVWFLDEPTAEAAGFIRWDRSTSGAATAIAAIADVPAGRHGPGSATPESDGSGPSGWTVKGNEDSMLYHTPESPSYKRTIAEVWFFDVATAEAAGFNRWDSGKSQREEKQR